MVLCGLLLIAVAAQTPPAPGRRRVPWKQPGRQLNRRRHFRCLHGLRTPRGVISSVAVPDPQIQGDVSPQTASAFGQALGASQLTSSSSSDTAPTTSALYASSACRPRKLAARIGPMDAAVANSDRRIARPSFVTGSAR